MPLSLRTVFNSRLQLMEEILLPQAIHISLRSGSLRGFIETRCQRSFLRRRRGLKAPIQLNLSVVIQRYGQRMNAATSRAGEGARVGSAFTL